MHTETLPPGRTPALDSTRVNNMTRLQRSATVLAILASAAAGAYAQSSPYWLGVSQVASHDSYMERYGGAGRDWISSTGLRAGIDQSFGRQQLLVDASANRNVYARNKALNNTDYGLNARLNWSTVERVSGLLAVQSSQSLYKNTLSTQVAGRNVLRSNGVTLQAQVGLVTVWSFDAGVSTNRQRISGSAVGLQSLNRDQTALSTGARWSPSTDLSVRLGVRRTQGDQQPNDDFTRNDVDLSTSVKLSGASDVFARLSSTRLKHSQPTLADQKGWTGLLGWNWVPTGKLKLGLTASRDSSLGSIDQIGVLLPFAQTTNSLSNTLALSANWEITSKVLLDSRLSQMRRTLDTTSLLAGATGKDTLTSFSLGLRYLPVRNLELGCSLTLDDHAVDSGSVAVPAYNARVVSCYGQAYLR